MEPDVLWLLDEAHRHDPPLHLVDSLDGLVAAMHSFGDGPLLFAVEAAQSGSYIAARAIIQTMLPKLGRLAHSVREGRCFSSVMAEAVATMYEVIYRYPCGRRPRSVAANLALDTLKSLRRDLGLELPASEVLGALVTAATDRSHRYCSAAVLGVPGSDELARVLAEAQLQGLVSCADAQLLWLVATGGSGRRSPAASASLPPRCASVTPASAPHCAHTRSSSLPDIRLPHLAAICTRNSIART